MRNLMETYRPLTGLGMVSLVLGTMALILFFLPILGIPISVLGLFFGIIGFIAALFLPGASLRWGLAGIATCSLALFINIAIVYAPAGYMPSRGVRESWEPPPGRPYIPPPSQG